MSFSQVATANDGLVRSHKQNSSFPGAIFPLGLVRGIMEYLRHQREYKRLLEMPDFMLDDIGLTRTQIIEAMRRRLF